MSIRWKDGDVLTRRDAERWLELLRNTLEKSTDALKEDLAAGGDGKNPCFNALLAVREHLCSLQGFGAVMKPFDTLITAAIDLHRGHVAPVFKPRRGAKGGAPKEPFAQDHVRTYAIAAVEIALRAKLREPAARNLVAAEFKSVPGMVGASGLREWRSRASGEHPTDRVVSKRVRDLLRAFEPELSEDGARAAIRSLVTTFKQKGFHVTPGVR